MKYRFGFTQKSLANFDSLKEGRIYNQCVGEFIIFQSCLYPIRITHLIFGALEPIAKNSDVVEYSFYGRIFFGFDVPQFESG